MTIKHTIVGLCLAACNLGPRAADPPDAARPPDAPPLPDGQEPYVDVLPPGSVVPGVDTNAELLIQIRINDGLLDTAGPIVKRANGKAAGQAVKVWNFGPSPFEGGIGVVAPVYVFGTFDADMVFTPSTEHPPMLDTLPGDIRYSAIRRVINVPLTTAWSGERITSLAALGEALERGLIGDPVEDTVPGAMPDTKLATWVNMPVVLPGTTLEVGPLATDTIPTKQVYARGHVVDVFEIGTAFGRQVFRSGFMPIGQASGLQTSIPLGNGSLPTAIDTVGGLVFQFAIPPAVTPNAFSYSPLATDVTVRLATGTSAAPHSDILNDNQLFTRNAGGAITGFFPNTVANFTVGTTVTNIQIQFVEGMP